MDEAGKKAILDRLSKHRLQSELLHKHDTHIKRGLLTEALLKDMAMSATNGPHYEIKQSDEADNVGVRLTSYLFSEEALFVLINEVAANAVRDAPEKAQ